MEAKSRKLFKVLTQRVLDSGYTFNRIELEDLLKSAVSSLPQHHQSFKEYLSQSFDESFSSFLKFYNKKSHTNNGEKLLSFVSSNNNTQLKDEIINSLRMCSNLSAQLRCIKKFCNLILVKKSSELILSLASAFYNFFDEEIEKLLKKEDAKAPLPLLKSTIISTFIILEDNYSLLEKNYCSSQEEMVPFKDLLTATFSLIIDVTILEHQHFDDEDKCIEVGSSLIEAGWILLTQSTTQYLESLLQLSALQRPNADLVLLRVYEFVFLKDDYFKPPLPIKTYLQYLIVSRQCSSLLNSRQWLVARKIEIVVYKKPAPSDFYKSIYSLKGGQALLEKTALMQVTKPLAVTKYLMKECDLEVLEQLLDLCVTADSTDIKNTIEDTPSDLLYTLDTKPDGADDKKLSLVVKETRVTCVRKSDSDHDSGDELLKDTEYLLDSPNIAFSGNDDENGEGVDKNVSVLPTIKKRTIEKQDATPKSRKSLNKYEILKSIERQKRREKLKLLMETNVNEENIASDQTNSTATFQKNPERGNSAKRKSLNIPKSSKKMKKNNSLVEISRWLTTAVETPDADVAAKTSAALSKQNEAEFCSNESVSSMNRIDSSEITLKKSDVESLHTENEKNESENIPTTATVQLTQNFEIQKLSRSDSDTSQQQTTTESNPKGSHQIESILEIKQESTNATESVDDSETLVQMTDKTSKNAEADSESGSTQKQEAAAGSAESPQTLGRNISDLLNIDKEPKSAAELLRTPQNSQQENSARKSNEKPQLLEKISIAVVKPIVQLSSVPAEVKKNDKTLDVIVEVESDSSLNLQTVTPVQTIKDTSRCVVAVQRTRNDSESSLASNASSIVLRPRRASRTSAAETPSAARTKSTRKSAVSRRSRIKSDTAPALNANSVATEPEGLSEITAAEVAPALSVPARRSSRRSVAPKRHRTESESSLASNASSVATQSRRVSKKISDDLLDSDTTTTSHGYMTRSRSRVAS